MSDLIVKHLAGSKAYGTNLPTSDTDIRGLFCAEPKSILTPFFPIREKVGEGEDEKYYELTNFIKLYVDCNPNIIETLWVRDADIIVKNEVYDYLRSKRSDMLSKKIVFTFTGYAFAQLKRIKGHNKWINKPELENKPSANSYVKMMRTFVDKKIMPRDFDINRLKGQYVSLIHVSSDTYAIIRGSAGSKLFTDKGEFNIAAKQDNNSDFDSEDILFLVKFVADEFKRANEEHRNYKNWKKNRNASRHELEEKFGYDTKHGMHLVRLIRMCEEALTTGHVNVYRSDAQELLGIRNGEWAYDDLLLWAQEKERLIMDKLYPESNVFPKKPDIHACAEILMKSQKMAWEIMNER